MILRAGRLESVFGDVKYELAFKRCVRGALCVGEGELNAHRGHHSSK